MTHTFSACRRIGILSDTHGHLSRSAKKELADVNLIIHAGDIGSPDVLDELTAIAPVIPVKGNMDSGRWTAPLHDTELIDVDGTMIYVLHDRLALDLDPETVGIRAVVSGHTHRPEAEDDAGILYLNPGSASFPRHGRAPTVAVLDVSQGSIHFRFIELVED